MIIMRVAVLYKFRRSSLMSRVLISTVLLLFSINMMSQDLECGVEEFSIEVEDSAKMGYSDAEYRLGKYYYQRNKYNNKTKIKELFSKSADKGNACAMYALARYMEEIDEMDVKKKYQKEFQNSVFSLLQKSAGSGNADALYALYCIYNQDPKDLNWICWFQVYRILKLKKDDKKRDSYFQLALSKGSTEAYRTMAIKAEDNDDYSRAVEYWRLASDRGDRSALGYLADAYYSGRGVTQDKMKALELYRKLNYNFRLMKYYDEIGDTVNSVKCLAELSLQNRTELNKLYKMALNGNPIAQYWMGEYCLNRASERNNIKYRYDGVNSEEWFLRAAKQNYGPAKGKLAYCYSILHGTNEEYEKSGLAWARAGANQGDVFSMHLLGLIYALGYGVEKSRTESYRWYKMAAENGDEKCQDYIGSAFLYGDDGFSLDLDSAAYWLEKSANQGNVDAYSDLGILYSKKNDVEKSFNYFLKAANKLDPYSIFRVGLHYYTKDTLHMSINDEGIFYKQLNESQKKGLRFLSIADSLGNSNATYYLAKHYYGIAPETSMCFFKKAVSREFAFATYELGKMYFKGDLLNKVEVNYSEAFKYLKQTVELDSSHFGEAMHLLSLCYRFGRGTEKDLSLAEKWEKKAAEANNASAIWIMNEVIER